MIVDRESNTRFQPSPEHIINGAPVFDHDPPSTRTPKRKPVIVIHDTAELRTKTFKPIRKIVGDIIGEGFSIIASSPKVGKTWFGLQAATAIARGGFCFGDVECEQGDVLFLSLETPEHEAQWRLTKQLGAHRQDWPSFSIAYEWPQAHQGGLDHIEAWIRTAKNPRAIFIDTYGRFRKPSPGGNVSYEHDYEQATALHEIAVKHRIAIIGFHHTKKGDGGDDGLDLVSGTHGLTAGADAAFVLRKTAQGTSLYGRGRSTSEIDKAMEFSPETCCWTITGERTEIHRSEERQAILDLLKDEESMSGPEVATALDRNRNTIRSLLARMVKSGELTQSKRGRYSLASTQPPLAKHWTAEADDRER